jgi:hypothetical protein
LSDTTGRDKLLTADGRTLKKQVQGCRFEVSRPNVLIDLLSRDRNETIAAAAIASCGVRRPS